MPAQIANPQGSQRWVYGPDGRSASRAIDDGVAVLVGQAPSLRPESPRELGGPDWQYWLPTLRFTVKTDRFVSEFDVERQMLRTLSDRDGAKLGLHIVWRVDYSALELSVDGSAKRPAAELGQFEWLRFDMLLLGLLGDWPALEDEATSLDEDGKFDRVTFSIGGLPSGTWDSGFVRVRDGMWQAPSASKLPGRRGRTTGPQRQDETGWRRVEGVPAVTNTLGQSTLTYRGVWQPPDQYTRKRRIFDYEGGGYSLPIPVIVPDREYDPPVWSVVLPHAMLMADGWGLEKILGTRSAEEWKVLDQALAATVPSEPIKIAQLVNGVVDALLHWQPTEAHQPRPPEAVELQAITTDTPYWPFLNISASMNPHYFRMF